MDVRNCCGHFCEKFGLQSTWTDLDRIARDVAEAKEPIYEVCERVVSRGAWGHKGEPCCPVVSRS